MKQLFLFCSLLLLASVGCSSSQNSTNGTTFTWNGSGADVQVIEDNYKIHMPTSFPAGNDVFHITNNSSMTHAFKIKGNGVEVSSPNIPGNGSTDLSVTLTPGTYHVLCPIIGHADLGMWLDVTVTQGH